MYNRWQHLKGIFNIWWLAVNGAWLLVSSADTLVGKFATPAFKNYWDSQFVTPKWGWKVWIIGFAVLTMAYVFEFSYRLVKRHAGPSKESPRLYLEYSEPQSGYVMEFCGLVVHNAGSKPAFKTELICENAPKVRLYFREMPIQKIDPDKGTSVQVRTEYLNDNGLWYPIGGMAGGQIRA